MRYVVKAETHDGVERTLRGGFESFEDAEDHPVKLSDWRRVWIDEEEDTSGGTVSSPKLARINVDTADRDELAARVEQIDEALRNDWWMPPAWRLTPSEGALLNAILLRNGGSKQQLHAILFGGAIDGGPEIKIIDVFICKLRRKLKPWGIQIETYWGRGYGIEAASLRLISAIKKGEVPPSLLQGSAITDAATRPVKPIGLPAKLKPAKIVVERPDVRMANPLDLRIERAYQRDLSEKSLRLIKKIVAGWDWAKFKPPVCAETEDGLFLIDGQHTAIAAATHPDIVAIPIMVVPADTVAKRADAFVAQNRDRIAMSAHQIFHAQVAAGDERAVAIMAIIQRVGAIIPRSMPQRGTAKPGEIASINELANIYGGSGGEVLERVLNIAVLSRQAPLLVRVARGLRFFFTDPQFGTVSRLPDTVIADALTTLMDVDGASGARAKALGITRAQAVADLLAGACEQLAEREAA